MKKIVFIHLLNDRSGSPKVLSQTIKALKDQGYQTELLTSSHQDGFLTGVADTNRSLFYRRSENKFVTLFYYVLSQILLFFQCLKYWNEDVIFYINTMMPFGGALAGKLISKKVIYHVHETSLKPQILKKFLRSVISLTAHKVIFVSEYLQEVENFKNKKQVVIYNALERSIVEEQKVVKDIFIVLMICSLKEYKGVLEFIKLSKFLSNVKELQFQLVLNASKDEINEYLKGSEKPSNLIIFDRQKDLSKFYRDASLLLNLSRPDGWIETFGLTILEGMEYGLPAVVPPVGGPTEIVREGIDGFQISCYETEKIADKIKFLMDNKDEYLRLSKNARERVKEFDIKVFEEKICEVVENI
jgi:glycosyltransferase involved in cell wall biosynthesis